MLRRTKVAIVAIAVAALVVGVPLAALGVVQTALATATGGAPENSVLANGELTLVLHYRGLDGAQYRTLGSINTYTAHDQTATSVPVPRSRLDQGPGYYSFEPTFANLEAKNNVQVPGDPTMANRDPAWNWIY